MIKEKNNTKEETNKYDEQHFSSFSCNKKQQDTLKVTSLK